MIDQRRFMFGDRVVVNKNWPGPHDHGGKTGLVVLVETKFDKDADPPTLVDWIGVILDGGDYQVEGSAEKFTLIE